MGFLRRKKPPTDSALSGLPQLNLDSTAHFWIERLGWAFGVFGLDLPVIGTTTVFTQMEIDPALGAALVANLQPVLDGLPRSMSNLPEIGSGSHAIRVAWEPPQDHGQREMMINSIVNPTVTGLCQYFNIYRPRAGSVDPTPVGIDNPLLQQLEAGNTWHR